MRHCADSYVGKCIATNARLASVTRNQRRVATAMFDWTGDELNLTQISGKANRPVATALSKSLETLHIEGAKENFEAPTEEFHIRRAQGAEEPFDIGAAIEEQIRPQGTATLITYTKANDMTALLTNTGDFIREVEITPVRAIADTFHMEFRSRLLTAKNPLANQRNFSLSLDRDGLLELKALIERSLEELPC